MASHILTAPAKINLTLHITGKRKSGPYEGFHNIESLIAFTGIADRLIIDEVGHDKAGHDEVGHDDDRLSVTGPFAAGLPTDQDNFILKILRAARERASAIPPLSIILEKNIPVGAGLGGGTSDGAALLRFLKDHYAPALDGPALARELGADGPACYHARALWATGLGEVITPLPGPLPQWDIVLVYPNRHCETVSTYRGFSDPMQMAEGLPAFPESPENDEDWRGFIAARSNALTRPASLLVPEIAGVLALLEKTEGAWMVRMSGSGSCCYALYSNRDQACAAKASIAAAKPEWWVERSTLKL